MHQWGVRGVFAAAVVALPLQLAVRDLAAEPYPGLYQPSFGGEVSSGPTYDSVEPRIAVTDADGSTRQLGVDAVLPPTGVDPGAVFRSAFREGPRAHDPDTAFWLRQRLQALEPGSDPQDVTVDWVHVEHRVGSTRVRTGDLDSRVLVDVRSTR